MGTGATIQTMVFGNLNDKSGTGVAFTRNPSNGDKELYGEYLINAQGEDVVAGIRTPHPIKKNKKVEQVSLESKFPKAYKEFLEISTKLENHFKEAQDIEFTEITRTWDFLTWPNATKGFFKFKECIPSVLSKMNLA